MKKSESALWPIFFSKNRIAYIDFAYKKVVKLDYCIDGHIYLLRPGSKLV